MFEELLLKVDGADASVVNRAELTDLGLFERTHLQEWVLAHPQILGPGTTILVSELADWEAFDGQRIADRLDVLGIGTDGRLIVAELKRGEAPHAVTMQALTYAAMVSRLTIDDVAELYARKRRAPDGGPFDVEEAKTHLQTQLSVTEDSLRNPRVVLIASDFTPSVTNTVLWLIERELDISLVRFRPYRLDDGQVVVSFARILPVPDLEEFRINRRRADNAVAVVDNGKPWDREGLARLERAANPATLALMDLCSQARGEPVTVAEIMALADITVGQVRGQLAGLTMLLKHPRNGFAQKAWPVRIDWQPNGVANYYLPEDLAAEWRGLRGLEPTA